LAKVFNEMTGQLQASQQSQKDFIANVSHELKTPLTAVEGFAQAILDGTADSPEAIQRSAQVIRSEAGRMHRMVMDLLDLARLDAGTADFQRAPVDLGKLLSDITARFIPLSHDADVNLQTHIRTLPGFIGDGDRLAQVFANLIDNAIKHTPAGGEVTLYAEPAGDKVKIWVSDTGQGIPPEELSRVFERFYQLDKSRRGGKGRGVGLGLAIAREIVHAHGGGLTVESHVGQGSKFIVQLPVARPDDETLNTSRKVE
jgi:signal transduction histidine kinase